MTSSIETSASSHSPSVQVAHSPLMDTVVAHYGVNKRFSRNDALDKHLEEIFFLGFTVVEGVLSSAETKVFGDLIDRIYVQQMSELGGEHLAEAAQDTNHIRCPLAYDDNFVSLAKHPVMIDVIKRLIGENFVLMMQNAVINQSGDKQYQTRWHRDLNYQHWTSSQVLAANALFCIDDFSAETGGTYVLPSTHLREPFPSEDFVRDNQKVIQAPAGSLIIMNGMLYHRAGRNVSTRLRRAVNHVVGLPFMAQQIDIPNFVGDRLAIDDFSRNYFGYRWRPAADAKSWRMGKIPVDIIGN